jgi:hypothetical protein
MVEVVSGRVTDVHNFTLSLAKRIEALEKTQQEHLLATLEDLADFTPPPRIELEPPYIVKELQNIVDGPDPLQCECGEHLDLCEGQHEDLT